MTCVDFIVKCLKQYAISVAFCIHRLFPKYPSRHCIECGTFRLEIGEYLYLESNFVSGNSNMIFFQTSVFYFRLFAPAYSRSFNNFRQCMSFRTFLKSVLLVLGKQCELIFQYRNEIAFKLFSCRTHFNHKLHT